MNEDGWRVDTVMAASRLHRPAVRPVAEGQLSSLGPVFVISLSLPAALTSFGFSNPFSELSLAVTERKKNQKFHCLIQSC